MDWHFLWAGGGRAVTGLAVGAECPFSTAAAVLVVVLVLVGAVLVLVVAAVEVVSHLSSSHSDRSDLLPPSATSPTPLPYFSLPFFPSSLFSSLPPSLPPVPPLPRLTSVHHPVRILNVAVSLPLLFSHLEVLHSKESPLLILPYQLKETSVSL